MCTRTYEWLGGACIIPSLPFLAFLLQTPAPTAEPPKPPEKRTPADYWSDLASLKGPHAYNALCDLVAQPDAACALLKSQLRPAPKDDKLQRLLTDLDSRRFAEREVAMRELERLGHQAEPALQRILDGKPSLELSKRINELLAKLHRPITDPEILRMIRAVEALERIDSPQARELLQVLANGNPDAHLTREARSSLQRLGKKPVAKP